MKKLWITLTLILSIALAGCTTPQRTLSTPAPILPTTVETTQMPQPRPTNPDPVIQSLIEKATDDLSQRLAISADQINLIQASEVTWPDGSLGCPREGMSYIQVLTPGYLIVLENNNNQYGYHSGRDGNVFYCPNQVPPIIGNTNGNY